LRGSYQDGFGILFIPAILALSVLLTARLQYPSPRDLEAVSVNLESKGFSRVFWLYLIAVALIAAGYADFPLIAFHFKKASVASDKWIPIFYSVAMGVDALSALFFGRLFDRIGISVLIVVSLLSSLFAPLVFLGGFDFALLGVALWGVGMGAQESIMRAAVAVMVPMNRRGSAYGIFNTGYGVFWFLGSVLMGILYDKSIIALIIFSVVTQLASVPFLLIIKKEFR
jgi:MFS family permease